MTLQLTPARPWADGWTRFRRITLTSLAIPALGVVALAVLQGYAFREGFRLQRENPAIKLGAGPLVGQWDVRVSPLLLPAMAIAIAAVIALPIVADRWSPRRAVLSTAAVAAGFVLALAASDGWSAVLAPVVHPTEYWAGVADAPAFGEYLRTYLDRQQSYSVHVRGHPPGFVLLLLALRAIGLENAWFTAALSLLGVAMAVGGVAFTVLRLAGREVLTQTLPLLALAPYAVWQGTSADAFLSGAAAVGIALLAAAATTSTRSIEVTSAVAGGAVLGACCYLTFGAPTLIPLVLAVVWRTRRLRWVPTALVGLGAVVGAFAWWDYWWLDGLANTRRFYEQGTAQFRPGFYFFFANLAALTIAIGPAALAGLTRLRRCGAAAALVVGSVGCVLIADGSGLSKAETERIWLLYMPWLSVAGGAVASTRSRQRLWLGLQATSAIMLQATLVSKW